MKRDYDYFFKFVLIGDTCIGKSCLLVRFAVSYPYLILFYVLIIYRTMTSKKIMLRQLVLILDLELCRSIRVQ